MNRLITSTAIPARELKIEALASISASFERLCLAAGLEALGEMMEADAQTACGPRHGRGKDRTAHRWGKTKGKIGFHGGKVEIARPRLRSFDGKEQALPSWEGAMTEDWLGKWAMNQMLINVSTRKFERSMRLPEGDVPAPNGSGLSKSAASRRFVALSAARLKEWMGSDLSDLGLLVIQIDGIHMDEDMTLVAAIGVDVNGDKHPLGLVEGATENAATVQALIDNLVERGLDPAVPRLFIIDGSKALSKAIRATFGRDPHDAVAGAQLGAAAVHGAVFENDFRIFNDARPQKDAIPRHADDIPLKPSEIRKENLDSLLFALRPAFGDELVPKCRLVFGSRQHGLGRAMRPAPIPNQIGPPVRRRRGQLRLPRDRIDAGRLTGDLPGVTQGKSHLRLRYDRRAHQDLACAMMDDQGTEIINAIEHRLVTPQHFVDCEGSGGKAALGAVTQAGLMQDFLPANLQPGPWSRRPSPRGL